MLCFLLSLCLSAEFNFTGIGYHQIETEDDTMNFILNFEMDGIFILDNWSDNYQIWGRGLDMTEPTVMVPNSIGFVTYFLDQVIIQANDAGVHKLQFFSLPKEYCNHKVAAFSPFAKQTTLVNWTSLDSYFNLCFISQENGSDSSIHFLLKAETQATRAVYSTPEEYSKGEFIGTQIENGKTTPVDLTDGMIVRLHGANSNSQSLLKGTVKSDQEQDWNERSFVRLPYYFIPVETGYNYVEELGISLYSWETSKYTITVVQIIGVTISVASMLAIIVTVVVFARQIAKDDHYLVRSNELSRTFL